MIGSKRQLGESDDSQNPSTKIQKSSIEDDEFVQKIATKVSATLEATIRRVVKEEMYQIMLYFQSSPRLVKELAFMECRSGEETPLMELLKLKNSLFLHRDSYPSRSLQLKFVNKMPSTLFTNSSVEDEKHVPLQIKLVDANSKSVIKHDPFSSMKVEIFVLNGDFPANGREDWTESEINENIVREREGKRPLLVGDLSFALVEGVGSIGNIMFTDNSSWVRSKRFKLGVRVMSRASLGTGIREAVSEAFVVLDHRGESYQKHRTPSLEDPVWRLQKIAKQGASHRKLESNGIKTVKDFLRSYHKNSRDLQNVLGNRIANKAWDTMVKHANECQLNNTYYTYCDAATAKGVELVFNCVHKVVAVIFGNQHLQTIDALDVYQKALVENLKLSAFSNLNQLVQVDETSAISSLMQSYFGQYVPGSTSMLDLQHNPCSFTHKGKPEKQLDIDHSNSGSYPCTFGNDYLQMVDDSTSKTNQSIQGISPSSLMMGDPSSAEHSNDFDNWYQNNI